jgi:hypothetical protein
MESLKEWWSGVLGIPGATWIIYPSLLFVLILIAYYVLQAIRNLAIGGSVGTEDHLGTFRKMRDEGMLDSEEYKKLAGLVPMPEVATNTADAAVKESGSEALTEAAKEAIRKAALKRSSDSSEENDETDFDLEDDQSTES